MKTTVHYYNGDIINVQQRALIYQSGYLGIYAEQYYFCITTLSGYGIAYKFRCLATAKEVTEKLALLDEWDAPVSRAVKLHSETSYKHNFAAEFAYMWSETPEEFKQHFYKILTP